jgi:hypothetical protein
VLLGRITAGQEASDRYVAIKLQTPRPPHDASEDESGLLTHRARERRWQRELRHYQAVSGVEEGFSPLNFIESASDRTGRRAGPRPWPPLLYCRERKLLFRPRDASGEPLATCRDEDLLRERGLPPYESSVETLLYNRGTAQVGGEPKFHLWDGHRMPAGVGDLTACLEDQSKVAGMPGVAPPQVDSAEAVARFARLTEGFPCLSCPEREDCYGQGLYKDRLEPFCSEETHALVMDLNRFHYDEFCDVLGRIDWKSFDKQHLGDGAGEGRRFRLREVERLLQQGRRYMFGADGSGMDALEIFKLKWTLFLQTCQAALEFHRRTGTAHLRLEPRHVMIDFSPPGDFLPTMWQFRARLISLGAMAVEPNAELGETIEIPTPPTNSNAVYDAEIVRNSTFGVVQRGAFIVHSIEPAEKEGRFVIEGELRHEGLAMRWLSPKDRIKVILRHLVGSEDLAFFTLRDPEREYSQQLLRLHSHPLALTEEQRTALERVKGVKLHNAAFALYPIFSVPCDLYSLGMLLFRTLTVNDGQSIGDVALALDGLRQDMESLAAVECEEGRESEFWDALLEGHMRNDVGEIFARRQVFYSGDDRDPDRPNAIPAPLWSEALVLGLQMIAQIEGFGLCENHGDFDLRYPAGKLEPVLRRGQEILRKIDTTLMAMSKRNAEIRAALESVLTETMSG